MLVSSGCFNADMSWLGDGSQNLIQTPPPEPGQAYRLAFGVAPPTTAAAGQAFSIAPNIQIQDSTGILVTQDGAMVTLAAYSDPTCSVPATGTFSSTVAPQNSTAGITSFGGLAETIAQTLYVQASSPGLLSACSSAVQIVPGAPSPAQSTISLARSVVRTNLPTSVTITTRDTYGNALTTGGATIGLSLTGGTTNGSFGTVTDVGDGTYTATFTGTMPGTPAPVEATLNGVALSGTPPELYVISAHSLIGTGNSHSCAISGGEVFCWGRNSFGALGDPGGGTFTATARRALGVGGIGNLSSIISVAANDANTCVLRSDGAVFCWGYGGDGALGNGGTGQTGTPTQVLGVGGAGFLTNIATLGTSSGHSFSFCAITTAREVVCWGLNTIGQIGNGLMTNSLTPSYVRDVGGAPGSRLGNIVAVSIGLSHACAVSVGGSAYCWGANDTGQLGDNSGTWSGSPVQVVNETGTDDLTDVVSISVGTNHACATNSTGDAFCWGDNSVGQLGNGSLVGSLRPVRVANFGGTDVSTISAAEYHTCSSINDGSVYCWGSGSHGQIGGVTSSSLTPNIVPAASGGGNLADGLQVSAGFYHSCAATDSNVFCWGQNSEGQLGDGTGSGYYTTNSTTFSVKDTSGIAALAPTF